MGSGLDRLRQIADELASAPGPSSPAAAMGRAEALYGVIDRLEAAAAVCVQTVDGVGEARAAGYASTVGWLRTGCGMLGSRAAERVAVARQLRRLPEAAARFAAGTVTYSTVAVLARVARNLTDADAAKAEPILLGVADELGPDDAAVVGRKIDDVLHPDGNLPDKDRQFGWRWLKINDLLDGMGSLEGLLDPELKNRLRAALDPLAAPAGADDPRAAGQRYADALHTLLSGTQTTHMSVVVDLKTLDGGPKPATLPDGSPLSAEDARRIAVNAGLSRVIVGPASLPLDVGREHRLATAAQRRALEVRDRQCVVDGCTIPAAWCEVDHITPWTLGGATDLANLALCCCFHNRFKARHPERVQITRHPDGKITYRIQRRVPPRYRHGQPRDRQPRDGPDTEAA